MKTTHDHKYIQRAVAPIIATLLMVAISVVGGILIFVFAQGFFTDTTVQTPNIESLEIFGYDARDQAALKTHIFDPTATSPVAADGLPTISTAADGFLSDGDQFTIFVRNKGAGPVTLTTIKVYGVDYNWDIITAAATLATGTPGSDKEFAISIDGLNAAASPVLGPGQDATLIFQYDAATNGKIKIGRPIPVVISTGSGATFTKQVQNGVTVG